MDNKKNDDLCDEWSKLIGELATMNVHDVVVCPPLRSKIMDLSYRYIRSTGKRISQHRA